MPSAMRCPRDTSNRLGPTRARSWSENNDILTVRRQYNSVKRGVSNVEEAVLPFKRVLYRTCIIGDAHEYPRAEPPFANRVKLLLTALNSPLSAPGPAMLALN